MRKLDTIAVHCSDSTWACAKVIDEWHRQRGWKMIGYTYVINNGYPESSKIYIPEWDGLLENGRPLDNDIWLESDEQGAHVSGHNKHSFGICMIGKKKFTRKQFHTLCAILWRWKAQIPNIKIMGHYQFDTANGKTCPNFDVNALCEFLANETDLSRLDHYLGDVIGG